MKIAWIQDLHLKPCLWFRKKLLVGDMHEALNQIAQICVQRGVSALLLGGDVYDSPRPEAYALKAFSAFCQHLNRQGIEIWDLQGNHDKTTEVEGLGPPPSLAESAGCWSMNNMLVTVDAAHKDGGIKVFGLNFAPAKTIGEQLANVPLCHLLCMHARFQHMIGFEEAYNFTLEDIPFQVGWCVLCGDIHDTNVTEYMKNRWFVSSGSIYPTRYGEHMRDHTVCILDTETRVPELVKLKCRKYLEIDNIPEDQLGDYLVETHNRALYEFRLEPVYISSRAEELSKTYSSAGLIFAPQARQRPAGEEPDFGFTEEGLTLEQAIAKHCKDDAEVYSLLTELVASGNPAQYLEDWLKART